MGTSAVAHGAKLDTIMTYLWIAVALGFVAWILFWPRGSSSAAEAQLPAGHAATSFEAGHKAAESPPQEASPGLLAYEPLHADAMPESRRRVLTKRFRDVPHPPKLLQHLLSPDFLSTASSAQLVDLINAEPLIAAKLLAAVNSPMYGLPRPASGIEQAVMVLGVYQVRTICIQYMLINAFKPSEDPKRAERLQATWRASALASEMTQSLCQALHLEGSGAMVSAVVLSFLGRLAIEASVSDEELAQIPNISFLARSRAEQQVVGLAAAEVGRLLMRDWGLPEAVTADAADMARVLTTPADASAPDRDACLALCYFCARTGERLAEGRMGALTSPDLIDDDADVQDDFFHLRGYLAHPWLRNLGETAKSPALAGKLQQMLSALRS